MPACWEQLWAQCLAYGVIKWVSGIERRTLQLMVNQLYLLSCSKNTAAEKTAAVELNFLAENKISHIDSKHRTMRFKSFPIYAINATQTDLLVYMSLNLLVKRL